MNSLELDALSAAFGETKVIDGISLRVEPGELVTLLGPSGSGKTTVLRLIAGYLALDSGTIRIQDEDITQLAPEKRNIGMVFQSYALFPHLSVFKNIAFGLERRRIEAGELAKRVERVMELVDLQELASRYPRQLSGGQRQRVALARALVIEPRVLLLDEPLSNLDAQLRERLRHDIRNIQRSSGITTILVTHDQEEALTVSDRVAVLDRGRLQQLATPEELYTRPATRFVAGFIGKMNWIPLRDCREEAPGSFCGKLASGIEVRFLSDMTKGAKPFTADDRTLTLGVRPESFRLGVPPTDRKTNRLTGTVSRRVFLGERTEWHVTLADNVTLVLRTSSDTLETDTETTSQHPETLGFWWPVETGRAFD